MSKKSLIAMIAFLIISVGYIVSNSIEKTSINNPVTNVYDVNMKQDLLCLMLAYPEFIKDVVHEDGGNVYIIMKSGRKILYDDKKDKSHEQKLANPDLEDMMYQNYPLKNEGKLMEANFDPGRGRVYTLLNEVYGGSKTKVEANLVNVSVGGSYQFNRNNKAADSLKNVMKELVPLAKSRRDIAACVYPCGGTFNYRYIAGTNRLSAHSFGIAIDLARDKRDYWQWASREQGQKRLESYPTELVEIFERNGFVWGGKWGHFDILHFEYRPEIILKAKYFGNKEENKDNWYDGAPLNDELVKISIEKINEAIN
jgi:hypothetical protein